MTDDYSERIKNALNDIQMLQAMFKQKYGEECFADKEIEEVLKIAKKEHEELKQYRELGIVEECKKSVNVRRQVTEIVNRQLIAGEDTYEEVYSCFWEIVRVIQDNY